MKIINTKIKWLPILIIVFFIYLLSSSPVFAHVKWFVEYDISAPPRYFMQLLTPVFFGLLLLSLAGVILHQVLEKRWQRPFVPFACLPGKQGDLPLKVLRIGMGIFFIALWLVGGVILTPELETNQPYIAYIQLTIPFMLILRRTLWLAGLLVLGLYGYAIYRYGFFHLMDYLFFVGIAFFLILSSQSFRRLLQLRMILLTGTLSLAFMWSAIEKLAYPQWFDPLLDQHPVLQMGLERSFFVMTTAFVEFTLFYVILTGKNWVSIAAFLGNLLIISGNIYFGKVDAIGHFPANVVLTMIILMNGHYAHYLKPSSPFKSALLYLFIFPCIIALYYLIHAIQYRWI